MFDSSFEQLTTAMVTKFSQTYMINTFESVEKEYGYLVGPEKEFMSLLLLQGKNNVSEVPFHSIIKCAKMLRKVHQIPLTEGEGLEELTSNLGS